MSILRFIAEIGRKKRKIETFYETLMENYHIIMPVLV